MGRFGRAAVLIGALIVLGCLWLLPAVVFPHPGTNDAIVLSDLEWPILLVGLIGVVIAMVVIRGRSATAVRTALGVFLLGVGVDLTIGLAVFGNSSNDRFAPLLFLPGPIGGTGLVLLAVGVAASGFFRPELLRGAIYGITGAVVVGVWTLVRGARDWLLAPYGFDIFVLVIVLGAVLALLSTRAVRAPVPPG